jgi:hypothetical protein
MSSFVFQPRVYAALYLSKKTKAALIAFAQNVVDSMNANSAIFVTPSPYTLADCATAIADYTSALAAAELGGTMEKAVALEKMRVLQTILIGMQGYVEAIANEPANYGSAVSVINAAGMEVRKSASAAPAPDAVSKLTATYTYVAQTIGLSWQRSKHAKGFEVWMSTNPDDASTWTLVMSTDSRKVTVDSLTTGTTYYFKVVAMGHGGSSPDSSIVSCIAA